MKKKILSTFLALALVLSLGLVMVTPVAANVGAATVTPDPNNIQAPAVYTIVFETNEDLAQSADDDIRIEFPADTFVPDLGPIYTNLSISINGTDVDDTVVLDPTVDVVIDGRLFIIDVPEDIPHGTVTVVFSLDAGLLNPTTPGMYTVEVSTSREVTPIESEEYEILGPAGPVDLYMKHVAECGYIEYIYVESWDTIQDALDEADLLFIGESEYDPEDYWSYWYLYTEITEELFCDITGVRIEVHPGTYPETILIDTPGVELVSIGDATDTIIDAEGLDPEGPGGSRIAAVFISAGAVTFDGFTVMNAGVGVAEGTNGWTDADDNDLADARGIYVWPWGAKNLNTAIYDEEYNFVAPSHAGRVNILNNIVFNSQAAGIQSEDACVLVNGNEVYDNLWDGFVGSGLFPGVEVIDPDAITGGDHACSEIIYNEFYENGPSGMGDPLEGGWTDAGIEIMSAFYDPHEQPQTLYIVGNDIHNNTHAGIYLQDDATYDMVVIKFNQIEDNGIFGISTKADYPIFIVCIYNDIMGNGVWGIKNWQPLEQWDEEAGEWYEEPTEEDTLVATHNYFGHISGPSCGLAPEAHEFNQQSDALGQGDAVSHYVEYRWWLTDSFKVVRTGLIRHYGSDLSFPRFNIPERPIVFLKQGWNTMSTPVALDQRADQLSEIYALGGWMQKLEIAFTYDPVNGWRQIVAGVYDPALMPLEAMLVKMAGPDSYVAPKRGPYADRLPILLRTTNWLPARDLEPGWNLVGPNMGFWSQDGGTWRMLVSEVLSSIEGSWGVAISPDMPGQKDAWVCTPATADDNSDYQMFVGDGYWVFITKSTTLAGFRMAPWYLQDWEMDILNCELPPWWLRPK